MSTVYRKTPKGIVEIQTRAHRLQPRVRNTLILVDGQRSDDELREMVTQELDECLRVLSEGGFIEAIEGSPVPRRPELPREQRRAAAKGGTATHEEDKVQRVRREAVKQLLEQVGPMAEDLAIKLERASDAAQLRQLLASAERVIAAVRGRQAADAFRSRFAED